MIKNHLARAAAVGALGVTAASGFVAPASAAQTAAPHIAATSKVTVATLPNTNIKGGPLRWSPTKLTVKSHKGTTCTSAKTSFTITNKTSKAHAIQEKTSSGRQTIGTLKAGQKAGICVLNAKVGAKGKLYIKGSTSVLTVTVGSVG